MRCRLHLESLESRITPTSLGTLSFDATHLAVTFAPPTAGTTGNSTSPSSPLPPGTVTLHPPSANSASSLFATLGVLSAGNMTDNYFIPNANQGASLTVALAGSGPMTLSVLDQNGSVLGQQTGSGPISLTISNVPVGGVTVVVTGTTPTTYLLTSILTTPSATPATPPAAPVAGQVTVPLNTAGLTLMDPYGVGDSNPAVDPAPVDVISWEWASLGTIQLYDPIGRPIFPWSPPVPGASVPLPPASGAPTP